MTARDAARAEEQARRLAAESLAAGDPTGWFEHLYAAAQRSGIGIPWDRRSPNRLLVDWADANRVRGVSRSALLVGCGFGEDAEHVAALGFDTTAFDIAPSAVKEARQRFPASSVRYLQADLFDPPARWHNRFDLVVEIITVQAMPPPLHERAARAISGFLAPHGTLLVIAAARAEPGTRPGAPAGPTGPPWPLSRSEVDAFAGAGIEAASIEEITDAADPANRRWQATFRRPGG
jgi:SAM-dependent methyltransferase